MQDKIRPPNPIRALRDNVIISNECLEARRCITHLLVTKFISEELANEILINIDKVANENKVFITKPFRRNESIEKDLFTLMKSRGRAFLWSNQSNDESEYEDKSS